MKKLIVVLAVLGILVAITAAWAANVKIVIEGESYNSIHPSMTRATSTVASGGAYIHIPLQRPHGNQEGEPLDQGRAVYKVRVPEAGRYRFWARTHWHDGCGNSFFLRINNNPPVVIGQDGTYKVWHWVRGPLVTLAAGEHTIVIQNREDGAKLDQWMLTNDLRYVPVRAERETPQFRVR